MGSPCLIWRNASIGLFIAIATYYHSHSYSIRKLIVTNWFENFLTKAAYTESIINDSLQLKRSI